MTRPLLNKLPATDVEVNNTIKALARYQVKHIHEMTDPKNMINGEYHHEWSDDGHDYMIGALRLGQDLINLLEISDPEQKLKAMFDPTNEAFVMDAYACDGIANEIADYADKLNPGWQEEWDKTH